MQPETTYADLIRIQDRLQAGVHAVSFCSLGEFDYTSASYLELIGKDISMSILKRPVRTTNTGGAGHKEIIVRVNNLSEHPSQAQLKCLWEIAEVALVNLDEQEIQKLPAEANAFHVRLEAWQIQTYRIRFA